jgi:hypothetical protein
MKAPNQLLHGHLHGEPQSQLQRRQPANPPASSARTNNRSRKDDERKKKENALQKIFHDL